MISAIQSGVLGMERASKVVDTAADNIAKVGTARGTARTSGNAAANDDIARDSVNMIIGHRTYDANAKVVEVAAKMLDTIV